MSLGSGGVTPESYGSPSSQPPPTPPPASTHHVPNLSRAMTSQVFPATAAALQLQTLYLKPPWSRLPSTYLYTSHSTQLTTGSPAELGEPVPCATVMPRSEEHTSELQSQFHLVCRLLLEKKKIK